MERILGLGGVFVLALTVNLSAEPPKAPPKPITPEAAIKAIGEAEVIVEMVVVKAKDRLDKRGVIFLDSEADYKDPKNLGVGLSVGAAAKLKAKGIKDIAAHFEGKTIRVKGCVMRFEERPYLPVLDPDQIEIIEKK